jgi:hypothetical protein
MKKSKCLFTILIISLMMISGSTTTVQAKDLGLLPFDAANFTTPQDNLYMPMALGDTYVYEAETDEEFIHDEITNSIDTKVILGVTCTVSYDVEQVYIADLNQWFISEETEEWFAWDNDGNVWYFGEDSISYDYDDDWNLIGTSSGGSWEAGVDGAEPGVLMLAEPMPGLSYQQEYYEGEAEDMGKVLRLNDSVEVEYGEFDDCLVTKEWSPLELGHIEHKYYSPGLGLVFIQELKGKPVLSELVDIY